MKKIAAIRHTFLQSEVLGVNFETIADSGTGQLSTEKRYGAAIKREGGEDYAHYITYLEIYHYDNCKKQQPSLCKVDGLIIDFNDLKSY